MIERYLAELRRLLGRGPGRARVLAEVEDHLRETARRLEREGALAVGAALGALEVVQRNALYRELDVGDPLTPLDLSLVTTWVALLGVSALAAAAWSLGCAFGPRPA